MSPWSPPLSVMKFLIFLGLSANVVFGVTTITTHGTEADLVQKLLTNYQKLARPVKHPSSPVILTVGMAPLSINQFDEENQVLVLDTYTKLSWKDENLLWDPLHYFNITSVRLPSKDVWVPDLTLYTATPDSSLFPPTQTRVLVYSDGTVLWVPMFTLRSRCPMSRETSKVTCHAKMGSWTYGENLLYINLDSPGIDMKNFVDNNHNWKLQSALASRDSKLYPCCPELYSALHFNFTLVRSDLNSSLEERHLKNDVEQIYLGQI